MAKYDLKTNIGKQRAKEYFNRLIEKGALIELKSLEKRSLSQNNYLHLILSWYALEFGYTLNFVKLEIFKKVVNSNIFVVERKNKLGASYFDIRSTAKLSRQELTMAIDRFRDWSSKECAFYLPQPSDLVYLREIQVELSKNQQYL